MYFPRVKPKIRRPAATRRLGQRLILQLCCRLAILVLCVSTILFLSKLAFSSKHPASRQPFLEVDATTESCYDSIRSPTMSPGGQAHTFDRPPSSSGSNHVKRDEALLRVFRCLVNEGERFLEEGLVYATGRYGDPPQDFGDHPFRDNGWSEHTGHDRQPWDWDEIFDSGLGGMPPTEQNFYVRLTQDQLFNNAYGSNILVSQPLSQCVTFQQKASARSLWTSPIQVFHLNVYAMRCNIFKSNTCGWAY